MHRSARPSGLASLAVARGSAFVGMVMIVGSLALVSAGVEGGVPTVLLFLGAILLGTTAVIVTTREGPE